jgi:hypothetical protein
LLEQNSPAAVIRQQVADADRLCDVEAGAMCEKCVEIDRKIEHYRLIESRMTDPALLEGIKGLIEQLQTAKVDLHPDHAK